jgi:ribosomal protein S18 acetylase RimI-like enzyme
MAGGLIERYMQVLTEHGRELCLLTVAVDNGRGIHFYEMYGFVPYIKKFRISVECMLNI